MSFDDDNAMFPAYNDYIFGSDAREEADEEPGLHPQQPWLNPQLFPNAEPGLYPQLFPHGVAAPMVIPAPLQGPQPWAPQQLGQQPQHQPPLPVYQQFTLHRPQQPQPPVDPMLQIPFQQFPPQMPQQPQAPPEGPMILIPFRLKLNINNHMGKYWQCVHDAQPSFTKGIEDEITEKQEYAREWLVSLQQSLPAEGRQYVWQLTQRMQKAEREGRNVFMELDWDYNPGEGPGPGPGRGRGPGGGGGGGMGGTRMGVMNVQG